MDIPVAVQQSPLCANVLKYDPRGGRMENTWKARSRIKPSGFAKERSLKDPYKIFCCLTHFLVSWEKTAMGTRQQCLQIILVVRLVQISAVLEAVWSTGVKPDIQNYSQFSAHEAPFPWTVRKPVLSPLGKRESHSRAEHTWHKSREQSFKRLILIKSQESFFNTVP